MQTLGDIIDQMMTVACKQFAVQEKVQDNSYKEMDKKELVKLIDLGKELNMQRAHLIDEYNAKLARIIKGEEKIEFPKLKTG